MRIIELLEESYDLYGVCWKQEPHLIQTDFGEKRLRYWKDEELLNWHVRWRDESAKGSGAVPDRMIRTRDGEPAIHDGDHWITLHDCADDSFGYKNEEERWGQFIGHMLRTGHLEEKNNKWSLDSFVFRFDNCLEQAKSYEKGSFLFLNNCIREAEQRLEFASAIKKNVKQDAPPLLERDISLGNGKKIFHFLFYQGGESWPVRSYLPIRKFLFEWLILTSPESLSLLLDEVHAVFPLDGDQGMLLLSEIVMPWEMEECLLKLDQHDLEKMVEGAARFEEIWLKNRQLLKTVTAWFDAKRKKVAL